jgi:GGDEF domain-containing protein
MVFPAEKVRDPKAAARWIGFMSVPDVAKASAAVEKAGGKIIMKPRRLGARGDAAVFADPPGSADEMTARADELMYAAKREAKGSIRVATFGGEPALASVAAGRR